MLERSLLLLDRMEKDKGSLKKDKDDHVKYVKVYKECLVYLYKDFEECVDLISNIIQESFQISLSQVILFVP